MDSPDLIKEKAIEPLVINDQAAASLAETRKWTNFFGIIGIIMIAFMLLASLVMVFVLPFMNQENGQTFPALAAGILYLVFSAVYVLPVIYLLKFSKKMRESLTTRNEDVTASAFQNLALHFRTVGIITIVFISLYIVFILAMIIFGMGLFAGSALSM